LFQSTLDCLLLLLLLSQGMIVLALMVGSNYFKMKKFRWLRMLATGFHSATVTSMGTITTSLVMDKVFPRGISHLRLHKHTCSGIVFMREKIIMRISKSRNIIQIVRHSSSNSSNSLKSRWWIATRSLEISLVSLIYLVRYLIATTNHHQGEH